MWGKCLVTGAALAAIFGAVPAQAQNRDQQWDWCKGDNAGGDVNVAHARSLDPSIGK